MKINIDSVQSVGISIEDATADEYTDDGTLHDYKSGDIIRPATPAEIEASRNAGPSGAIEIDGRSCYVGW